MLEDRVVETEEETARLYDRGKPEQYREFHKKLAKRNSYIRQAKRSIVAGVLVRNSIEDIVKQIEAFDLATIPPQFLERYRERLAIDPLVGEEHSTEGGKRDAIGTCLFKMRIISVEEGSGGYFGFLTGCQAYRSFEDARLVYEAVVKKFSVLLLESDSLAEERYLAELGDATTEDEEKKAALLGAASEVGISPSEIPYYQSFLEKSLNQRVA